MNGVRACLKRIMGPEAFRAEELWGSLFDLWFLLPLVGVMVGSERGGNALAMGRDLIFMGGAWLLSAILFRTSLPLQPLKVWAFLFLILHPSPLAVSLSGVFLGGLIFLSGQAGLVRRLEETLSPSAFDRIRRGVGFYVRGVAFLSMGLVLLRHCPGLLPAGAFSAWPIPGEGFSGLFVPVLLLVLPQLPVTLVNGLVSTVRERREAASPSSGAGTTLTGRRLSRWVGLADLVAGAAGVLPFCHGSGNLWVYRRHAIRSLLPSLASSLVLIGLGSALSRGLLPLPSMALSGGLLAGFLAAEFFLKGEKKRAVGPRGEEHPLSGLLEFWAMAGGAVSASLLLGGLPLLLVFLLGVNAALAVPAKDKGSRPGVGLFSAGGTPEAGSGGISVLPCRTLSPQTGTLSAHPEILPLSSTPDPGVDPSFALVVPADPERIVERFRERFFRRPREIPDDLVLPILLLLFAFPVPTVSVPRSSFPPFFFRLSVFVLPGLARAP